MNTLLTIAFALSSLFHTALKSSIPAKGSIVTTPKTVTLVFTEPVNVNLTTIAITLADSSAVESLVVPKGAAAATVVAPVTAALKPGKYLIKWKTASDDGHVVRGVFAFAVKAGT
jgi:methionine-rich copper-binding protein CopC